MTAIPRLLAAMILQHGGNPAVLLDLPPGEHASRVHSDPNASASRIRLMPLAMPPTRIVMDAAGIVAATILFGRGIRYVHERDGISTLFAPTGCGARITGGEVAVEGIARACRPEVVVARDAKGGRLIQIDDQDPPPSSRPLREDRPSRMGLVAMLHGEALPSQANRDVDPNLSLVHDEAVVRRLDDPDGDEVPTRLHLQVLDPRILQNRAQRTRSRKDEGSGRVLVPLASITAIADDRGHATIAMPDGSTLSLVSSARSALVALRLPRGSSRSLAALGVDPAHLARLDVGQWHSRTVPMPSDVHRIGFMPTSAGDVGIVRTEWGFETIDCRETDDPDPLAELYVQGDDPYVTPLVVPLDGGSEILVSKVPDATMPPNLDPADGHQSVMDALLRDWTIETSRTPLGVHAAILVQCIRTIGAKRADVVATFTIGRWPSWGMPTSSDHPVASIDADRLAHLLAGIGNLELSMTDAPTLHYVRRERPLDLDGEWERLARNSEGHGIDVPTGPERVADATAAAAGPGRPRIALDGGPSFDLAQSDQNPTDGAPFGLAPNMMAWRMMREVVMIDGAIEELGHVDPDPELSGARLVDPPVVEADPVAVDREERRAATLLAMGGHVDRMLEAVLSEAIGGTIGIDDADVLAQLAATLMGEAFHAFGLERACIVHALMLRVSRGTRA